MGAAARAAAARAMAAGVRAATGAMAAWAAEGCREGQHRVCVSALAVSCAALLSLTSTNPVQPPAHQLGCPASHAPPA